jgi:hypothetical protein
MRCSASGLAAALLLLAGAAFAHGDWQPKHGGVVSDGETTFELVAKGRNVVLHVEDHGAPVNTSGAHGVLTVTRGTANWSANIRAIGDNRLSVHLPRALMSGDMVLAKVTLGNGSVAAGRFKLKAAHGSPTVDRTAARLKH